MEDWVWWMIAAGVAAGEIFTMGFFLGPIAIAATLAAIVSLVGGGLAASWVVFIVASIGSLLVLPDRPALPAHPARIRTGTAALVGGPATVVERVDADGGCVKIGGELWTARAWATRTPRSSRVPAWRSRRSTAPRRSSPSERKGRHMATLIVLGVVALVVLITLARAIRIVPQARAGIVERLGRYNRTLDAGLALVIPYVDRVRPLIDLREQVSFPPQPVITEDNLVINIDTVIYFQVTDLKAASYEIADYIGAIEQLTVTTLRNVIGGMTLEDTLTSRDNISAALSTCSTRPPASGASA